MEVPLPHPKLPIHLSATATCQPTCAPNPSSWPRCLPVRTACTTNHAQITERTTASMQCDGNEPAPTQYPRLEPSHAQSTSAATNTLPIQTSKGGLRETRSRDKRERRSVERGGGEGGAHLGPRFPAARWRNGGRRGELRAAA